MAKTIAPVKGAKTMGTKTAVTTKPAARAAKTTPPAANTRSRTAGANAGTAATKRDPVSHRAKPAATATTASPKGGARSARPAKPAA